MLEFNCLHLDGSVETVHLGGFSLFCAGYTGRDRTAIEQHIRELEEQLGVPRPRTVPTCFPMVSRLAMVAPREVEVYGTVTSGEAEPVLLRSGGRLRWLAVGSDHTDRAHERHGIAESKNLCPKILSSDVWDLAEIANRWDTLQLRSWSDGELYQEAPLAIMLPVADLVATVPPDRLTTEAIIMGGTIPTVAGLKYGGRFECSLSDPQSGRELRVGYNVRTVAPIS